ncbi:carbohydrate-binding module family 5 protein [Pisolithus tinctorius]|uniref:chitinase n=1 Tax=Pisolithus tinctorius Marx 270 TaxID=870435 RepID=A0A0C3NVF5_PISTI|nr:carbohydrate-binding module family 5 protein [Pisolithus tinctorius]KIN99380.1 carbohydrate-binding module family 5 protein [Pisolithus tinctorius Marx 270]
MIFSWLSGHNPLLLIVSLFLVWGSPSSAAFSMLRNTNLAVYWGQDSYGANNPSDTTNWQQPISYYCNDDAIDTFPVAFLDQFFTTGGLPSINLANSCTNPPFSGTSMPNCTFLGPDIEACQAAGKIVTISLGGATGSAGFSNDSQAQAFAQTIWDLFLEGSSPDRPFGSAVLDGVDLDIEGGSQTGYEAFVTALRALMAKGNKQYYITAAPQCPYPDAYIGTTLNAVGFDAVYVQFYNNYCGLNNYNNVNAWDFGTWDNWAKTVSPNPNIKVYIGAPASPSAAGSGYINASTFATIIQQTQSQYSSFGGVMLWDASQAYANSRYDRAVKSALTAGGTVVATSAGTSTAATTTTSTATTVATTAASATATATGTSCSGVSAWSSAIAYVGGDQVTYNGQLWTAKWWTYDDVPGDSAAVWTETASC